MQKLNRAQKCSILGPQNLGSRGGPGPPLDPHLPLITSEKMQKKVGARCNFLTLQSMILMQRKMLAIAECLL